METEVRKYTPKTVRSYRNNSNRFIHYLDIIVNAEDLTLPTISKFSAYMVRYGKKGRYISSLLKTATTFLLHCYKEEYGSFNTKKNCKADMGKLVIFYTGSTNNRIHILDHM